MFSSSSEEEEEEEDESGAFSAFGWRGRCCLFCNASNTLSIRENLRSDMCTPSLTTPPSDPIALVRAALCNVPVERFFFSCVAARTDLSFSF